MQKTGLGAVIFFVLGSDYLYGTVKMKYFGFVPVFVPPEITILFRISVGFASNPCFLYECQNMYSYATTKYHHTKL